MISMLERFFYLLCEQWMQSLLGKNGKCQNQSSGIQFFIIICTQIEGFHGSSAGKESTLNVGDLGSIPGLGRSPGKGKDYPLQYSGLENPRDGGAWWASVYGVTQSGT